MPADAHGFPWGKGKPSISKRIIFAIAIGLVAFAMHYFRPSGNGGLSDFSGVWYGSGMLLHGDNPYPVIGPGRAIDLPSNLYYPGPALVAVAPFTFLPVGLAGAVFIFVSAALLAYGATKDSWYLLPMLVSVPFMNAARLGQWSIILTAALFLPWLAFLAAAKPQTSIPVLFGARSSKTILAAIIGAVLLTVVSFILLPHWASAWLAELKTSEYFRPPILSFGGAAILLVLLKWRRAESWIILSAACVPQTWYPYNALVLLAVACTYREACILSLLSSAGWLAGYYFAPGNSRLPETQLLFRNIMLACGFLPALIVVLRRPNDAISPAWLRPLLKHEGAA
ncbi:MAG TPA: glycosyltransferase family 87 protein [Gemmatimonadaceae bacterium]|nr:glycosyltransferase family 87 protein [Gemmatimonadaceae bacterium]